MLTKLFMRHAFQDIYKLVSCTLSHKYSSIHIPIGDKERIKNVLPVEYHDTLNKITNETIIKDINCVLNYTPGKVSDVDRVNIFGTLKFLEKHYGMNSKEKEIIGHILKIYSCESFDKDT